MNTETNTNLQVLVWWITTLRDYRKLPQFVWQFAATIHLAQSDTPEYLEQVMSLLGAHSDESRLSYKLVSQVVCDYAVQTNSSHRNAATELFSLTDITPLTQDQYDSFLAAATDERTGAVSFMTFVSKVRARGAKPRVVKTVDEQEMQRLERDKKSGVQYAPETIAARLAFWQAQSDMSTLINGVYV